jgi:hypothetical protein
VKKHIILLFIIHGLICGSTVLAGDDNPAPPFGLISDIDDTLRMTNVQSRYETVRNGLFGSGIFAGMQKLYLEMSKKASAWSYLSGSPHWMENSLRTYLVGQLSFPNGEFFLSNWLRWEKSGVFKKRMLPEILKKIEYPVILIGDDTESDPDVFQEILSQYGSARILKVYIHQIKGGKLPEGLTPYWSAFDIALEEFEAGRLSLEQVGEVAEAIFRTNGFEQVFPVYKSCPSEFSIRSGKNAQQHESLIKSIERMQIGIQDFCKKR